jgi:hypothetical protein
MLRYVFGVGQIKIYKVCVLYDGFKLYIFSF